MEEEEEEEEEEEKEEEEEEEEEEKEEEPGRKLPSLTPHTLTPPNNPQVVHVGRGSLDKDEKMEQEEEEDSPWDRWDTNSLLRNLIGL